MKKKTSPRVRPRKAITDFARLMELRLRANDPRKGRAGWRWLDNQTLLLSAFDEWLELRDALRQKTINRSWICKECADVANFMMMVADNIMSGER